MLLKEETNNASSKIKTKRIVTKIGDLFCVEIDNQYKRFFQYFANDMTQLNSSVIRVFKKKYPMDYVPLPEEITQDEVDFYAHTVLKIGIIEGAWYKIGKSKDIGDIDIPTFRKFADEDIVEISEKWYVWKIGEPLKYVGKLPPKYYEAENGFVKPYNEIITRIRTGQYAYFFPKYK